MNRFFRTQTASVEVPTASRSPTFRAWRACPLCQGNLRAESCDPALARIILDDVEEKHMLHVHTDTEQFRLWALNFRRFNERAQNG